MNSIKSVILIIVFSVTFFSSGLLFAAPIKAVVGLNTSQVLESNSEFSLSPISGSVFSTDENFEEISLNQDYENSYFIDYIGKSVFAQGLHLNLNYVGTLIEVSQISKSFKIQYKGSVLNLPLSDFIFYPTQYPAQVLNLPFSDFIPHSTKKKKEKEVSVIPMEFSYQTDQLSWSPQLSLVINDNQVTMYQQALIHNNSDKIIDIKDSILHFSHSQPQMLAKRGGLSLAISSQAEKISYQNSEAIFPFGKDKKISLAPHTDILYKIKTSNGLLNKSFHFSNPYIYSNSPDVINLSFENKVEFDFTEDGMPGQYNVFWKKDGFLIPSSTVSFDSVRAGQKASIATNKSLDLNGKMVILNVEKDKYSTVQEWRSFVKNDSDKEQDFVVFINFDKSISLLSNGQSQESESRNVQITGSKTIQLSGKIGSKSDIELDFKIKFDNTDAN